MPDFRPTTRDSIKAGLFSALWTFISLFAATSLNFSQEVIRWAQEWGATGEPSVFPSLSILAAGAVSAIFAALTGFVGVLVRLAQARSSLVPGHPPRYE